MSIVILASLRGSFSRLPAVVRVMWPLLRVVIFASCRSLARRSGWINLWLPPQSHNVYAVGGVVIVVFEWLGRMIGRLKRKRLPDDSLNSLSETSTVFFTLVLLSSFSPSADSLHSCEPARLFPPCSHSYPRFRVQTRNPG